MAKQRLIVGISGASGAIYGVRTLEAAKAAGVETHLVMTKTAAMTLAYETDWTAKKVAALADVVHSPEDLGAFAQGGPSERAALLARWAARADTGEIVIFPHPHLEPGDVIQVGIPRAGMVGQRQVTGWALALGDLGGQRVELTGRSSWRI